MAVGDIGAFAWFTAARIRSNCSLVMIVVHALLLTEASEQKPWTVITASFELTVSGCAVVPGWAASGAPGLACATAGTCPIADKHTAKSIGAIRMRFIVAKIPSQIVAGNRGSKAIVTQRIRKNIGAIPEFFPDPANDFGGYVLRRKSSFAETHSALFRWFWRLWQPGRSRRRRRPKVTFVIA